MSTSESHPLRCTHCGRPVRGTQHTRTDYRVDYYALHGGHGEVCALVGDFAHHDTTFIRLLDHYEVISCAECYPLPAVQAERERLFRPEAGAGDEAGEP
ncbi:hypothetical protein KF840_12145 [bacterium]|nr:hypothetical protein [bacterium]